MKNFKLIRSGVAVRPLLDELAALADAWEQQTGRQEKVRVQREALAIPLRGLRKSRCHFARHVAARRGRPCRYARRGMLRTWEANRLSTGPTSWLVLRARAAPG